MDLPSHVATRVMLVIIKRLYSGNYGWDNYAGIIFSIMNGIIIQALC